MSPESAVLERPYINKELYPNNSKHSPPRYIIQFYIILKHYIVFIILFYINIYIYKGCDEISCHEISRHPMCLAGSDRSRENVTISLQNILPCLH